MEKKTFSSLKQARNGLSRWHISGSKIATGLQRVKVFSSTTSEKILKKSCTMPKKLEGDPLVSPGIVCYAGEKERASWFSSLGQQVQLFRTFGRTILVTSGV